MDINIKDYGAVGNGKILNTEIIQKCVDICSENFGGRVIIDGGIFMTGKIFMRDNVELHITSSGILLGSPNCEDFPESTPEEASHIKTENLPRWRNGCIIFANECKNISITGMGTIDCNGKNFVEPQPDEDEGWIFKRIQKPTPPRAVFFTGCTNVNIMDITMVNQPAGWSYWIHDCDYVTFDRCKIIADVNYPNNDGIHVNCSRNVNISNCNITCGDDCIVIRANSVSLKENKVCEKVTITNCNLTSYSAGIRIGWMNDGVIKNCSFSNIVITDTSNGISISFPYLDKSLPKTLDNIYIADIGREHTHVENLIFSNIIMDKISCSPILAVVDPRDDVTIEKIKSIYFSNVRATSIILPKFIGKDNAPLERFVFTDCLFELLPLDAIKNLKHHGAGSPSEEALETRMIMNMKNTKDFVFNNTSISTI